MAQLSTHILDTSRGTPAGGVKIDLYLINGDQRTHIKTTVSNSDGRTDGPLLSGETITTGVYELVFQAGEYLRQLGSELSEPPFLDAIVIRFGIADPCGKYHVPLLLSPFGYSTYRGS